jgi:dTDP-4-amino-4,6-dideoxygalactose transaminase
VTITSARDADSTANGERRKGRGARRVPFNHPSVLGGEYANVRAAIRSRHISGNGAFTKKCHAWLEEHIGCRRALLTQSGTAALEMAALLLDLEPGDEVIMPSFAFVSTANAFVLRRAVPVFVDIRSDTLNIDEQLIERAITPRTRAIVALHYGGVGCAMDTIVGIAQRHGLDVIEDAAQAIGSQFRERPLGSIGRFGAVSFHETKNVMSGEGGALFVNDPRDAERAEILWEKGTNRSQFFRGQAANYSWLDVGSSFLPSELTAAFLSAQLEHAERVVSDRLRIWNQYHAAFAPLERAGHLRRPIMPAECKPNGHLYYLLLPSAAERTTALHKLRRLGIEAVFHYLPLHASPAGHRFGRASGELPMTVDISDRLIRLPLWFGMTERQIGDVIGAVLAVASRAAD